MNAKDSSSSSPQFDIRAAISYFGRSVQVGEDDVQLYEYVLAYDELRRLLKELGILFAFVEADVVKKCDILRQLSTDNSDAYSTVKTMVLYETDRKETSRGSRNLLRLHRALAFLSLFVEEMYKSDEETSVSDILRSSYSKTLANHHGWVIRNSIKLASHTVPEKNQLLKVIFNDAVDHNDVGKIADEFLNVINSVFDRVQLIYETHNLLNLP